MVELQTKESPDVLNSTVVVYQSIRDYGYHNQGYITVDCGRSKTPITHQSPKLIQVVEGRQILRLHCDITRIKPDGML
jgi:hypothetical protein